MSDHHLSPSSPAPSLVHWVDTTGVTRDPVAADVLLGWIDGGHLPVDTPAWWEGLDGWATAVELRALVTAPPDAAGDTPGRRCSRQPTGRPTARPGPTPSRHPTHPRPPTHQRVLTLQ
ncbi:MAG: hypothetical protein R2704_16505 [Microthrixaceae bacterium]